MQGKKRVSELIVEEEIIGPSHSITEELDRWVDDDAQWTCVVENVSSGIDGEHDSVLEFVLVDSRSMAHALPFRVAERFGVICKEESSSVRGAGGQKVIAFGHARVCLRAQKLFCVEVFMNVLAAHRPIISVAEGRLAGARCYMGEPLLMSFADGDREQTAPITCLDID